MTYSCKILKDSISPDNVRLISMEITFPRISLPQFNTHRIMSKSTASTRAVPVKKMIEQVIENPYIPNEWGTNQKGMISGVPLIGEEAVLCEKDWLLARDNAIMSARSFLDRNIHKELVNQLLIPWMWSTVIVTATEWDNFINLRTNFDVGKPILPIALMIRDARNNSKPDEVGHGEWHRPYITDDDYIQPFDTMTLNKISAGRCARVSYLTHDGIKDRSKDIELCDKLLNLWHMTPFEHVARPARNGDTGRMDWEVDLPLYAKHMDPPKAEDMWFGNFRGWVSMRKLIPNEDVFRPERVNNGKI